MVKILICGSVNSEWKLFYNKITTLQKSSHGPFDVVLCIGNFYNNFNEFVNSLKNNEIEFIIPTYICDNCNGMTDNDLPTNAHWLPACGVSTIQGLSIVTLQHNYDKEQYQQLYNTVNHISCDLLLTSDWPVGMEHGLPDSEIQALRNLGYDSSVCSSFSSDVSSLAASLCPRYHMCSSSSLPVFYQRIPYSQQKPDTRAWFTRFISLSKASSSKDKTVKWVHALSVTPCATAPPQSLIADLSVPHTPCPYKQHSHPESLEEPGRKKARLEDSTGGTFFFGDMGVSRSADNGGHRKPPPTADCRTLYIGGLSAGVRERDISDALPGSKVVRQPPGKNFAFVEFESHASAAGILERAATAVGVSVRNRPVTVGWANNEGPSSVSNRDNGERSALTTPPSSECRTLFIGGLPPAGGEDDDRIKSELLTMLKGSQEVHRISGKTFAFVEFDSHHSASAVVEAFSSGSFSFTVSSGGRRCDLIVGWSKGEGRGDAPSADCWFCLASPSVKVHLVVSVSNHMYLSLPRGGVTDFHVLAIPIECVNSRLKISPGAAVDLDRYQIALEKMFESLGMTSIRYERALRTRGRDHMQVHIVPIMKQHAHRAIPTFLQTASKYSLQFHEITGNVDLADVLSGSGGNALQGGPYEEYFYIELPISGSDEKRKFVFVKDRSFIRDKSAKFPMQFGSEVSAVAIDRPDRANWKNCALTEDQEKELCANFQSVFESFDFN